MEGYVTNGASAITCHATLSAELQLSPIFSLIRVCLAGSVLLYQCDQTFFTRLGSTFACLLSLQRRAGMRGMQASGLPVYSEGFLHCSPPSFLWRIFHIFVLAVVLGTGRGLGTWEPLVAFPNLCLVEFFPTAHIVSFIHTWDIFTAVN